MSMQSSTDILIAHDLQHKDPIHPWASTVVVIADYLSGTLGVIFNEIVVVSMATVPAILTKKKKRPWKYARQCCQFD